MGNVAIYGHLAVLPLKSRHSPLKSRPSPSVGDVEDGERDIPLLSVGKRPVNRILPLAAGIPRMCYQEVTDDTLRWSLG